ncbi:MAG: hypothetical protein LBF76_00995, partial [Holosporales bacterium]|nr:hypothetical protein [Holosporales bacterium]
MAASFISQSENQQKPLISPSDAPTKKEELSSKDTISLNTTYLFDWHTNAQLADFGMELMRLGPRAEQLFQESLVARWSIRVLELWAAQAFARSYREVGCGLRAKALGFRYILKTGQGNEFTNFFTFFLRALFSNEGSDCEIPEEKSIPYEENSRQTAVRAASPPSDPDEEADVYWPKTKNFLCWFIDLTREGFIKFLDKSEEHVEEIGKRYRSLSVFERAIIGPIFDANGEVVKAILIKAGNDIEKDMKERKKLGMTNSTGDALAVKALKDPDVQDKIATLIQKTAGHALGAKQEFFSLRKLWQIHFAGYNNSMYLAERLSEHVYAQKDVTFLEGSTYFLAYLSATGYSHLGADAFDICRSLGAFGDPIHGEARKNINTYAPLLSAALLLVNTTTYHVLYATFMGIFNNTPRGPWEPFGFRFPDIFLYFTTKGLSFKADSGFRVNDNLRFLFGVERVIGLEHSLFKKGMEYGSKEDMENSVLIARLLTLEKMFVNKPAVEYHVGMQQTLGEAWHYAIYRCVLTFGEGLCLEGYVHYPISKDRKSV